MKNSQISWKCKHSQRLSKELVLFWLKQSNLVKPWNSPWSEHLHCFFHMTWPLFELFVLHNCAQKATCFCFNWCHWIINGQLQKWWCFCQCQAQPTSQKNIIVMWSEKPIYMTEKNPNICSARKFKGMLIWTSKPKILVILVIPFYHTSFDENYHNATSSVCQIWRPRENSIKNARNSQHFLLTMKNAQQFIKCLPRSY